MTTVLMVGSAIVVGTLLGNVIVYGIGRIIGVRYFFGWRD